MVSSSHVPNEHLINWNPVHEPLSDRPKDSSNSSAKAPEKPRSSSSRRLRSACDLCRRARVKCSGGSTCSRCESGGLKCNYGVSLRNGRIKSSNIPQMNRSGSPSSAGSRKRCHESASTKSDGRTAQSADSSTSTTNLPNHPKSHVEVPFDNLTYGNNDDFLMGNDFADFNAMSPLLKNFTFNYPGPRSEILTDSTGASVMPLNPGSEPSATQLPLTLDFAFDSSQFDPASGTPRSISIPPPSLDAGALFSFGCKTKCRCLSTQLMCIAELCNVEDPSKLGLDEILRLAREKSKIIKEYLVCKECSKTSVSFIFPAIVFQRVVQLLCTTAANGHRFVQSMKLRVGSYELATDDDILHKKMLISSAAKQVDSVLDELRATTADYQQKTGDKVTESGVANLKWNFDTVRNMKARVKLIETLLEADDWGYKVGEELFCRFT